MLVYELLRDKYPNDKHLARHAHDVWGDIHVKEINNKRLHELWSHLSGKMNVGGARDAYGKICGVIRENATQRIGYRNPILEKPRNIHAWFTKNELNEIENALPKLNRRQRYYCLILLITSYTGCDLNDLNLIRNTSISGGRLSFVNSKGIKVNIPAHTNLSKWISEYIKLKKVYRLSDSCRQPIKDTIRKIGITNECTITENYRTIVCPKWKAITPLTGQRTFATNLSLLGVDVNTLKEMMGLQTTARTQLFIQETIPMDMEKIMGYFA